MNILKQDFDCYACHKAGWIINTLGMYIVCPVCKDSRILRNLKQYTFYVLTILFRKVSDSLGQLDWASEDVLRCVRMHNVDTKGHFEVAEELPFKSYDEVFKSGNEILENKYAHKILSSYLFGSTESLTYVEMSIKKLLDNQTYFEELYNLAKETHNNSALGRDTTDAFYNRLQEIQGEEADARN